MTRRHVTFHCQGSELVGTLDPAPGRTGLLIVTGGNELRSAASRPSASIAAASVTAKAKTRALPGLPTI
jgi:hypothetical protein